MLEETNGWSKSVLSCARQKTGIRKAEIIRILFMGLV